MRILGIDPGTEKIGWAVLEAGKPTKEYPNGFRLVKADLIKTPAKQQLAIRLRKIFEEVCGIIKTYRPDVMAVEKLFFCKNQKTAMDVGQARGVVLLAATISHLRVAEYTPMQVKMALTGYGKADKKQVQKMIQYILGQKNRITQDDTADAVAVAMCHHDLGLTRQSQK